MHLCRSVHIHIDIYDTYIRADVWRYVYVHICMYSIFNNSYLPLYLYISHHMYMYLYTIQDGL